MATTTHDVIAGENPGAIAQKYGTTVEALQATNPQYAQFASNKNYIQAGWKLNIPGATPIAPVAPTLPTVTPGPIAPTPLTIDTSKEPTSDTLTKYTSLDEIKKMLDQSTADINKTLAPTDQETALQKQLADIKAQEDNINLGVKKYENNLSGEGISAGAIQGRSWDVERNVAMTLESLGVQEKNLLTRLGLETEARTVAQKVAENKYTTLKDTIEYAAKAQAAIDKAKTDLVSSTDKMTDNTRQALTTILSQFKGIDFHSLSTDAQLKLQTMANSLGIPIDVIIKGMDVVKSQQDLDNLNKQKELAISQQNANRLAADKGGLTTEEKAFQGDLNAAIAGLASGKKTWADAYDTLATIYGKTNPDLVRKLTPAEVTAAGGDPSGDNGDQTYLDILLNKKKFY